MNTEQFLGAARRIAALRITDGDTQCPDCLPGGFELVSGPRRSLFSLLFPRRNRYRLGRLGNALVRGGSLRRVTA